MKKIISTLLACAILAELTSCGAAIKNIKPELTDPELEYTVEEIEALSKNEMKISDYGLPALYKYFDGKVKIGVTTNGFEFENYPTDDVAKGCLKNYNVYVLGNELKSDYCNPAEGVYNFTAGDAFVETAKAGGAELRGHTIVWHSQVPAWWFKADPQDEASLEECYENGRLATREQLKERLKTYINELIPRYKDSIKYWDVCNEVLNDTASSVRRISDGSYWADIFGDVDGDGYYDDYIEYAFNTVREAGGEDLVLIINEYNMEWQDSKAQLMYDTVERLLRKGVRIDGVGFQSHIGVDVNVETFRRNIERIYGLSKVYDECFPEHKGNFRVQITELDMNMFVGELSDGAFYKWSDEDFERQAEKYYELVDMFLDFADEGAIDLILFWGSDDEHSWLNSFPKLRRNAALLVDRDLTVKPSYWAVARAAVEHESGK